MLLPKRITRKYTYDESTIETKLYSVESLDFAATTFYMKNREDFSTKVETVKSGENIKHVLHSYGEIIYLSDEEYFNAIRIAFFRIRLHVGKIEEFYNEEAFVGYQIDVCPLIRKYSGHTRALVNNH